MLKFLPKLDKNGTIIFLNVFSLGMVTKWELKATNYMINKSMLPFSIEM
jgi:hypothetical protein